MDNLEDQLVRDESEVLHGYLDSEGFMTLGVGTLIDHRKGGYITREESRYLLRNRITIARSNLMAAFPWLTDLDLIRREALANMTFNMGIDHLKEFVDAMGKLQQKDFAGAAAAFLESKWSKQVGARAQRLAKQIETGQWQ